VDRRRTFGVEHCPTVPVGGTIAVGFVLRGSGRERAEPQADAAVGDEQYTKTPFFGVPKMTRSLRDRGYVVNPKRVRRLLRQMGLEAIYPKPRLSKPAAGHRIYPYRLRNVVIMRPDQVWSTDITYIRLRAGFIYLVAVMDWFSRYVLSWEISTSLDSAFCCSALDRALQQGRPEIFNTDQGAQFTSDAFTPVGSTRRISSSAWMAAAGL
jgi:putative transposase